jgi:histidine triad (HIT) family protein
MACAFCAIVAGELPAATVLEDPLAVAFLDTRPLFHGHVLLVPRAHVATLPDLPAGDVGPYFERVQRLSVAVRDAMGAKGTFVAINNVVSQSVPHLHTHVVPRNPKDGLRGFFWPRTTYADAAEADAVAARIRRSLAEHARGAPGSAEGPEGPEGAEGAAPTAGERPPA